MSPFSGAVHEVWGGDGGRARALNDERLERILQERKRVSLGERCSVKSKRSYATKTDQQPKVRGTVKCLSSL